MSKFPRYQIEQKVLVADVDGSFYEGVILEILFSKSQPGQYEYLVSIGANAAFTFGEWELVDGEIEEMKGLEAVKKSLEGVE